MGTLTGFPNPPALWLRWAKPTGANAEHGNPVGGRRPRAATGREPSRQAKAACGYGEGTQSAGEGRVRPSVWGSRRLALIRVGGGGVNRTIDSREAGGG